MAITVKRVPEDISQADVLRKVFGVPERDIGRMARGIETCEWNPARSAESMQGDDPGACEREAVLSVGSKRNYHLCRECAALPAFRSLRRRVLLSEGELT